MFQSVSLASGQLRMRTLAVTWETIHQFGEAWISHHRLRHKMFVEPKMDGANLWTGRV
jgi:hypothetical protein